MPHGSSISLQFGHKPRPPPRCPCGILSTSPFNSRIFVLTPNGCRTNINSTRVLYNIQNAQRLTGRELGRVTRSSHKLSYPTRLLPRKLNLNVMHSFYALESSGPNPNLVLTFPILTLIRKGSITDSSTTGFMDGPPLIIDTPIPCIPNTQRFLAPPFFLSAASIPLYHWNKGSFPL